MLTLVNSGKICFSRTDLQKVLATNVFGVYHLTALLVPALKETKGNVVNVSSVSGSMASVGSLPYSMSKVRKFTF